MLFKTLEPFHIPIPNYVGPAANILGTPPLDKHPETYVNIGVDSNYVYGLYSGLTTRYLTKLERIKGNYNVSQGKKLILFDKKKGVYMGEAVLPIEARKIFVTEDAVYALSVDPEIALIKYKKPIEFNHDVKN
ncbi:MAG: hypothetical protein GXO78_06955 [Calditrichaeota bacterium]|nr:hypothetical protein [Calditrichota bacterium]